MAKRLQKKITRRVKTQPEIDCDSEVRCDNEACLPIYSDCDYVFGDAIVIPARQGGTLVQWHLNDAVRDQGDYWFSLQMGNAGVDDPKAWITVATRKNVCFLVDNQRRLPGVYSFTHYRIKLRTGERVYYSHPLHTMGALSFSDWRQYEAIIRAEEINLRSESGTRGTILKRKISGIPCRKCREFNTGEVKNASCKVCYATGWVGGYYDPVPCCYFNMDAAGSTISHDVETQGPVAETAVTARTVASPILISGDVWVNDLSSERFRILQIKNVVESKGVPVVYTLMMERIPFSDIVYSFPLQ